MTAVSRRAVLLVADVLSGIRNADHIPEQPSYEKFFRMVRLSLASDSATREEVVACVDQSITG